MSNTGDGKKLATFNVEAEIWEAFKIKARQNGVNASALLNQWVRVYLDENSVSYLDSNLDIIQVSQQSIIDEGSLIERLAPTLTQQVRAEVKSHLEQVRAEIESYLGDLVNNLIDANLPVAIEAHLGKE